MTEIFSVTLGKFRLQLNKISLEGWPPGPSNRFLTSHLSTPCLVLVLARLQIRSTHVIQHSWSRIHRVVAAVSSMPRTASSRSGQLGRVQALSAAPLAVLVLLTLLCTVRCVPEHAQHHNISCEGELHQLLRVPSSKTGDSHGSSTKSASSSSSVM